MNVSKSEFRAFLKRYEEDIRELKSKREPPAAPINEQRNSRSRTFQYSSFKGVIPKPNENRSSKESSFVNVSVALREGIKAYNDSIQNGDEKIVADELDVSPLKWSRLAFGTV